jgi:hypothetical protein
MIRARPLLLVINVDSHETAGILLYLSVFSGRFKNAHLYCVHVNVNGKKIPVETISQMGEEAHKGEWWRG